MGKQSVQQIVEQCQRGDREAFGQLYTTMYDRLRNQCRHYVTNESTLDDLLHDAFLIIFNKIGSLKDTSRAEAWMQKVTHNLVLTYINQHKHQTMVPLEEINEPSIMPDTMRPTMNYEELMMMIDQLPNKARKKKLQRLLVVLMLSLLAIGLPIGLWHLLTQPDRHETAQTQQPSRQKPLSSEAETPKESISLPSPDYQFTQSKLTVYPVQTDSLPILNSESAVTFVEETREESTTPVREEPQSKPSPLPERKHQKTSIDMPEMPVNATKHDDGWTVQLAYSGFSSRQDFNLPYGERDMNDPELDTITHHRLPISVGLSVNKMLGRQFAIGTGLQYTQLYSETQAGNTYSWTQTEQRIHYLGIPLRVMWYPVNTSHLRVYGTAQTMFELPMGSTLRQSDFIEGRQIDSKKLHLDPKVQWSVGIGVGLEYRLSPIIGLYAEPSVHYFFKPGGGIETYRTAHPATFSVPIGIRINIK
jgi:RNA polymerase sigma-70 factor (ECF subfamily)